MKSTTMKKILVSTYVTALLFSIVPFALSATLLPNSPFSNAPTGIQESFSDVSGHRYEPAITFLKQHGVVSGYPDGSFLPDGRINRAELLTIIVGQKYKNLPSNNCFTDVNANSWYAKFVCKGRELGIVAGYPDGSFKPEQNVNFVEALIILQRAHTIQVNTESGMEWFENSVNEASKTNTIPLDVISFDEQITRGQMADMMTRLLKYEDNELDSYLGIFRDYRTTYETLQKHISVDAWWLRCQTNPSDCPPKGTPPPPLSCNDAVPVTIAPETTYLIISRKMFASTLVPFILKKESEGEHVAEYQLENIVCQFSGKDIPEKIRTFLQTAKNQSAARYLLLIGTPLQTQNEADHTPTRLTYDWEMPIRYVEGIRDITSIPTDQYYASLVGDLNTSDFSFKPDLYVGRIPVRTTNELANWIQKTATWVAPSNPVHSRFMSSWCIYKDYPKDGAGNAAEAPLDQTHRMKFHYCNSDQGGDIANFANQDGADFISTYSHGTYSGVIKSIDYEGRRGVKNAELGYELNKKSPGFKKSPVIFVHGCEVAGLDYADTSIGQKLIGSADGATAFVGATRSHWDIMFEMWDEVFFDHRYRIGEAMYEYKHRRATMESLRKDEIKNYFMFNLFGDPSLKLVEPQVELSVNKDAIDFHGKNEGTADFTLKNESSNTVSGTLYSYSGSQYTSSDPLGEMVNISPYTTVNVTRTLSQSFSTGPEDLIPSRIQKYYFKPTARDGAVIGGSTNLVYNNYGLSCGKMETAGNQWKLYMKANYAGHSEDSTIKIMVNPGYIEVKGKPKPVDAYQTITNFFQNPAQIFTFNKVRDQDSIEEYEKSGGQGIYTFALINIKVFSNITQMLVAQCNVSPSEALSE